MSDESGHEDAAALVEEYLESEISDGLPVVPPTAARVAAMVGSMGRPPGTVIGTFPPGDAEATVDHIAANAVLAGCTPGYGPVVLAAAEAMLDDRFALYGVACSTKGAAPLAVINGPVRGRIGAKSRGNLFGHGVRANATIGRALRLTVQNVAGAVPDVLDRATLGHPGKYSYCVAEDEEDSPWEPLHVERGVDPGRSAVTLLGCEAPRQVSVPQSSGEAILLGVAHTLASGEIGGFAGGKNAPHLLVLSKEHRDVLRDECWTKAAIRHFIAANAVIPAETVERVTGGRAEPVTAVAAPDDVLVLAGGGFAGRFSSVCPGWTWQSQPVTVPLPD